jgi:hypothetical protein
MIGSATRRLNNRPVMQMLGDTANGGSPDHAHSALRIGAA